MDDPARPDATLAWDYDCVVSVEDGIVQAVSAGRCETR